MKAVSPHGMLISCLKVCALMVRERRLKEMKISTFFIGFRFVIKDGRKDPMGWKFTAMIVLISALKLTLHTPTSYLTTEL